MTIDERLNHLKERLHTLKVKNAIDAQLYSIVETLLQQAEQFNGFNRMKIPPGVQIDLLVVEVLDAAENYIKKVEDKSS